MLNDLISLQIALEVFPLVSESHQFSLLYLVLTYQLLNLFPLLILHLDELIISIHIDHHIHQVLVVHLHSLIIRRDVNILLIAARTSLLIRTIGLTSLVCHIYLDLVRLVLDYIDFEHLLLLESLVELFELFFTLVVRLLDSIEVIEELLNDLELGLIDSLNVANVIIIGPDGPRIILGLEIAI